MIAEILLAILTACSLGVLGGAVYFGLRFFERAQLRHEEELRNQELRFLGHLDKLESKIKATDLKDYVENTQPDEPNGIARSGINTGSPMIVPIEQLDELPPIGTHVKVENG